ncbi:MAG: DEAD/DEAH box helicase family protein [Oscillibacter sp.]|nr:DEAD/DEAH box helicase family protein [Oscillibacter sp.]
MNINPVITDRYYRKMSIQAVCGAFERRNRKALLVMAAGTGKTRTAISLTDVLMSHRWVTNILFLADRVELVKQARDETLALCALPQTAEVVV